eukprot:gene37450-50540_t
MILSEGPDTIAAFWAEPLMGSGGVIVPPAGYYQKVQAILDKYDILFVADEVICGFGRLGHMFGTQAFDLKPDMIIVAKALSSGYQPISALMVNERVFSALADEAGRLGVFGHGFTYSAHPVPAAVALETLKIYEERDIVGHVRSVTPKFQEGLRRFATLPFVGDVRGMGLIAGLEIVKDKATKENFPPATRAALLLEAKCLDEGIVVRAIGDTVAISPPLIVTEAEIDDILARVEESDMNIKPNFVGGQWSGAENARPNINPSNTEDVVGYYAEATVDDVKRAAEAARTAASSWATSTLGVRGLLLQRVAELIEQRRDGTTVNVIERVRLVEAEGRTPVLVHTMTDITARVAVEAALRESEATLSLALESHHIGTFDWDATTRKITWSPGTEQRLGLQPGEMETFAQWLALVDPADMAAIYDTIQAARDRHLDHYRFQYRFNVPNGGVRIIEGSGRFNYGADGKLARIMGLNIDVTDRNAREAALLAQQEQFRSVLKTVPTAM